MTWTREAMLDLIDLERRRSRTRRVMSVAGLLLGGGLVGAGLVLLRRRARTTATTEQASEANGEHVLDAEPTHQNGASAHV